MGGGTPAMPIPIEKRVEGQDPREPRPESRSAHRHKSMHGHALSLVAIRGQEGDWQPTGHQGTVGAEGPRLIG